MADENINKDKKIKKQHKSLTIFLTVFIVTFAFVALAVKYFSPEIDVEIGKNAEETDVEDGEKGSVDERLRWIQFEDNMPGVSTRFTAGEENAAEENNQGEEEKIVYDEEKSSENKNVNEKTAEPAMKVETQEPKAPAAAEAPAVGKMSKIYIGQFSTIEQAIAMQNRISESGLNLSPFVKKVGSYYVVQVGSYASVQTAQNIVTEIQNAGYSARIVNE